MSVSVRFPAGTSKAGALRSSCAWAALALLALVGSSCSHLPVPPPKPKVEIKSLQQRADAAAGPVTPTVLQGEVMRFADEYVALISQAADDLVARVGTPEAHLAALQLKRGQATAAFANATGPSPVLNALDIVVLATVSRMVVEDYGVAQAFGDAALPLAQTYRNLETNAWSLVSRVLTPDQQQELRDLIQEWRRKNPNQRYVGPVRFREFVSALGKMPQKGTIRPTSLFSLFFLDPMAGLDPTTRAIEEAHYLAERTVYYAQRVPMLLGWQAELLILQLAAQPASKQLLADTERLSKAVETFSETARELPELISDERETAIQQLLDGIATERTNLLAGLAAEEQKLRRLLAEMRGTLETGGAMAASVNSAIQSLDAFVRYVSPPRTNRMSASTSASTNSKPFDVLDYGRAAVQVGDMAKDLNTLLTSVNQSAPQVAQLGEQAAAGTERVVQRAFWLGLLLIVILLSGSVLAGLVYRFLAYKLAGAQSKRTSSEP